MVLLVKEIEMNIGVPPLVVGDKVKKIGDTKTLTIVFISSVSRYQSKNRANKELFTRWEYVIFSIN